MKINRKNIFLQNAEFFVWLFFIFSISSSSLVQFIFFIRLSLEVMSDCVFIAFILLIPIQMSDFLGMRPSFLFQKAGTSIIAWQYKNRLIISEIISYQVIENRFAKFAPANKLFI